MNELAFTLDGKLFLQATDAGIEVRGALAALTIMPLFAGCSCMDAALTCQTQHCNRQQGVLAVLSTGRVTASDLNAEGLR